jgi:hypothetical protein
MLILHCHGLFYVKKCLVFNQNDIFYELAGKKGRFKNKLVNPENQTGPELM